MNLRPNYPCFILIEGELRLCRTRSVRPDGSATVVIAPAYRVEPGAPFPEDGLAPVYTVPATPLVPAYDLTRRILAAVSAHLGGTSHIVSEYPAPIEPDSVAWYSASDPQEANYDWVDSAYLVQVETWRDNNPHAPVLTQQDTRALHLKHWRQDQQRGICFTRSGAFVKESLLVLFPRQEPVVERANH